MNSAHATNPGQIVRDIYLSRKYKNPRYSTRAFARDIGVSQALLSLVMAGKRPLTIKQAYRISTMLSLPSEIAGKLVGLVIAHGEGKARLPRKKKIGFYDIEVDQFKTISNWHHVAILDLSLTEGFKNDPSWISKRLGISTFEVRDALDRLLRLRLLVEREDGLLVKATPLMYFNTSKSAAAVRSFHRQMLIKAESELEKSDQASFARREISGITVAVRASQVEEAKKRIQTVIKKLATEIADIHHPDEVYHLAVQFFPLTTTKNLNQINNKRKEGK